jgi:hypothetical protein
MQSMSSSHSILKHCSPDHTRHNLFPGQQLFETAGCFVTEADSAPMSAVNYNRH